MEEVCKEWRVVEELLNHPQERILLVLVTLIRAVSIKSLFGVVFCSSFSLLPLVESITFLLLI